MVNISRILCPIDYSEFSRRAVDYSVGIAHWYGAGITAIHVLPFAMPLAAPAGDTLYPRLALSPDDLQQYQAELAAFVRAGGVEVFDAEVVQGNVSGEILRFAQELPADLLVMGTHGRSGFDRLLLGSITEKVLRKATCPVLTVPAHAPDAAPLGPLFSRVLCAVDFSPASVRALTLAQSLAGEAAGRLCVMHVVEPVSVFEPVVAGPVLEAVSADVRRDARHRIEELIRGDTRAFSDVVEVVVAGKPYREILRAASEQRSDLIVLGAHGGHLGMAAFGSTTNHVVRQATCPVLTVRG